MIDPNRTQLLNPDHVGACGKAKAMTGITDFKFLTISCQNRPVVDWENRTLKDHAARLNKIGFKKYQQKWGTDL